MEVQSFCAYPFHRVRLTAEGNVAFCCHQSSNYIGNILETTFDDIWYGKLAEEIRHTILQGKLHPLCQVPTCPHKEFKNPETVEYNEYPTFLEIDLPNTHCNVGLSDITPPCVMCERANPDFKPDEDHLFESLNRIKHICRNLSQIHIGGIAEPFWGDVAFKILDILGFDKHSNQITVSTVTNGINLTSKHREKWLRRIPHSIVTFSIDAGEADTYKKIRILPAFDRVLSNLFGYSKERVNERQFLNVCNNINSLNVAEVRQMCYIADKAKVDLLEFMPTNGFNKEIMVNENNCGIFKKAEYDILEECEKLSIPFNIHQTIDTGILDNLVQII